MPNYIDSWVEISLYKNCRNVATISPFYRYYFSGSTSLFLQKLVIQIDCIILLSSLLDVKRMSMSAVFLCTVWLWNSLPAEIFPLIYDLHGWNSRVARQFLSLSSLKLAFLYTFHLVFLLFIVTPCITVAFQPCVEWIPVKKNPCLSAKNSYVTGTINFWSLVLVSCHLMILLVILRRETAKMHLLDRSYLCMSLFILSVPIILWLLPSKVIGI